MANAYLTNTVIAREAARILHQGDNFLNSVNTTYEDQFARRGAKAGATIGMRLPAKYKARKTATFAGQDHTERSTPLAVLSQWGVDLSFSTYDRTLSLDDFSKRVIQPAVKQLSAEIAGQCLTDAYKVVNNYVNATTNAVMTYKYFQTMGARMTDCLAPMAERTALLNPMSMVEFMDATKGLFAAQSNLNEQFREGVMGRTGGFDVGENTMLPAHTTGSLAGSPLTNGAALGTGTTTANTWASQTTLSIDGATSTTTIKAGDIITLDTVYRVHPETKVSTGKLQTFVVQSDVTLTTAATAYDVVVKPALIWGSGNAFQNVTIAGGSTDGLTVTRIGAASTQFAQDLAFHKDAFALAFVDLEDVSGMGAKCESISTDRIAMRYIEQYGASDDIVKHRIDVCFGFAPLYPELACRHMTTASLL